MPRELTRYLWDIVEAGERIHTFIDGKSFADYDQDELTRLAVERCFGIVGETMYEARNLYPGLKAEIYEQKQIVNFRNRIVHGYSAIDKENVWSIARVYLPDLIDEVKALLGRIQDGTAPAELTVAVSGAEKP